MSRTILSTAMIMATMGLVSEINAQNWVESMFESTKHNFGVVAAAAKAEHVFEFTNTSNQPIHLQSVGTSCGCITAKILTEWVKPGEVGQVHVRYNTDRFFGKRGASINVTVDQPQFAQVALRADGYVRRDIVVSPGEVHFATIAEGQGAEKTLQIKYAGKTTWQIAEVSSANPNLSTKLTETRRAGGRIDYNLVVSLKPGHQSGLIDDRLILKTNDSRMTQFPIRVSGYVKPVIEVPAIVDLGNHQRGTTVSRTVFLKSKDEFCITEAKCKDPRIQLIKPDGEKKSHIVRVIVDTSKEGQFEDEIVFKTDNPSIATITIPVIGAIMKPAIMKPANMKPANVVPKK